jgi:DNA-binding CsgD family transcriptional regulator
VSLTTAAVPENDLVLATGRSGLCPKKVRAEIEQTLYRGAAAAAGFADFQPVEVACEARHEGPVLWFSSARCVVGINRRTSVVAPFVALVTDRPGPLPAWALEIARLALLHFSRQVQGARDDGFLAGSVLDALDHGLAVVDASGRLLFQNEAAEAWLSESKNLKAPGGRLVGLRPKVRRDLEAAITAVSGGSAMKTLALQSAEDGPAEIVTLAALPRASGCALIGFGRRRCDPAATEAFLDAFHLTPAERRLVGNILDGSALEDAAAQSNLKLSTARSYLKSIFFKTGARRQAELVHLVGSVAPPLAHPSRPSAAPGAVKQAGAA